MNGWRYGLLGILLGCWGVLAQASWPGFIGPEMAEAVQESIESGELPGVVLQVEQAGETFQHVAGWRTVVPTAEVMTADTLFDVASLTKVVAATPSVMKLVEDGRVELDAPLARPHPDGPGGYPVLASRPLPVLTGLDVLRRDGFAILKGRRVGLITNHTGLARDRTSAIDLLQAAPGVSLLALFSPEHGIRGELDRDGITDSRDEKSGLPVHSLYGERRAPTAEQLKSIDTLVFDIQDIGCRFYTYVSTMTLAMEAAAKAGKRFIVLDRPNPIGGQKVQGPLREGDFAFIAAHDLPLRHGLTAGELARLIASERQWNLDLEVVRCENWRRSQWFDETGLPWINPSPNMRSLEAAVLYPGIGLLEFTNISVGRGTDAPFLMVGAPWIDADALAQDLTALALPGVRIMPVQFTPNASTYAQTLCHGVRFTVTHREELDSLALGSALASSLCRGYPAAFDTQNLNKLLLHAESAAAWRAGDPGSQVRAAWYSDERRFMLRRRPFLLYN